MGENQQRLLDKLETVAGQTLRARRQYQSLLARRDHLVVAARRAGASYGRVAEAIGMSRSAVQDIERRAAADS